MVDSTGTPVYEQTSVVFRTNLGTFRNGSTEYKIKTADDSGSVLVQLISGTASGTAEVWAESNKVKQKIEVKFFDPHKVGTIALRTGSASITADGMSQVSITATVTDAKGNPEDNATVKFNTSLGYFMVANPLPGITEKTTTAVTDVDGEATVMLVSSTNIGTATILASLNGLNATTSVIFTAGEAKTISLRAAPSVIRPNGASNLFATLQDINGNPVEGKSVVFSQLVNVSEGTINPLSDTTDVNGEAQAIYTAGKDPGENIIQAALSSDLSLKATKAIVVDPGAIVVGSISLTAGATSLVADGLGKVKIRASVLDIDGAEAVGKTVNFTTTAGLVIPASGKTSDLGLAETMLQATTIAGPVTVRAECDGFIAEVKVELIPGPADHILMYAFPNVVPPNGAFKTAAIIMDKYNNRIDDQRLILQVRKVGNPAIIDSAELTPDQAEDGVYRFDWTAAYGTEDLEITAKVNNGVSETVTIDVDENAIIVGSITVIAGAESIEADGKSSVAIRATVLDFAGNPAQGITVNFSTTLGTLSSAQEKTDQNGFAQIKLTSGTVWGTATVTANANGFIGQAKVLFTTGRAAGLYLTAMPDIVLPGGQSTIIAELRNSVGEPVVGEVLYFNIYENNTLASLDAIQGITDTNGRVTIKYTAGVIIPAGCSACCQGDRIRATLASDSSVRATTCVTVAIPTGNVGYMTLTSAKTSLPDDGVSSTAVTAKVFDTAGFSMPEGTPITFSTTVGTFPGGTDPDAGGPITSQVTLTTLDDTGTIITSLIAPLGPVPPGTVAEIRAVCGGVSQLLYIIIIDDSLAVSSITLTANPTSLPADGLSSSAITAVVRDNLGNPVPAGTPVTFTVTGPIGPDGCVFTNDATAITVYTSDTSGRVITALIAGTDPGIATVTAAAGSLTQAIQIPILEGNIGSLTLTANPASIPADGATSSAITATLRDSNGNPMPIGTEVVFATTLGTFPGGEDPDGPGPLPFEVTLPITNASGTILTSLISAVSPGSATVTATYGGLSQSVVVIMTETTIPVAESLSLSTTKTTVQTNGSDSATITALVLDENNAPVAGATVNFTSDGGQISAANVVTNASGQAIITFSSGPDKFNHTVTITASINALSASIPIVLYGTQLTLTPATAQLSVGGPPFDTQQIIVKAIDAGGIPIYNASIAIAFNPGASDATLTPAAGDYTTNYAGEISLLLTAGDDAGTATVSADGLNTSAEGTYVLGDPVDIFRITAPSTSPYSAPADGSEVNVTVHAGGLLAGQWIVLTTSFGTWTGSPTNTVYRQLSAANDDITVPISSNLAGTATIQAYSFDDPTIMDFAQISFYNPASKACNIVIDASQTNILPSTGTTEYSLVVKAKVYDCFGSPVGGAIVDFYLTNTTGGGEYLTPVSAITNSAGIAESTFTSGTLSTGSAPSSAVVVHARVATPAACTPEVITITCNADVGGNLGGDYFTLSSATDDYYVWYDVADGSTDPGTIVPALAAFTGIEVNIATNASANAVAAATRAAINSTPGFEASVAANVVTAETCGNVTDAGVAGNTTGFGIGVADGSGDAYKEDTIAITIGGAVANIAIGSATVITSAQDETLYELPVTVLVADTNGNPVPGVLVSLSLKPSLFRTGLWCKIADEWDPYGDHPVGLSCASLGTTPFDFVNEDLNNNAVLDGDEDQDGSYSLGDPDLPDYFDGYSSGDEVPGLTDGLLTPGQSVAGTIPSNVTTDENGVATFKLIYLKEYAIWVQDQITATCEVYGTEYITKSRSWLPYASNEQEVIRLAFPESPFNNLPLGTVP
jgi:protocatechuate 3,4-dioxygenase beta subunit